MTLSINQLKKGVTVTLDNDVFMIVDTEHVKPGKGAAFVRTKLKNIRKGLILEKTFKGDEKIEEAFIEEKKLEYLYNTGDTFHFMDLSNYEDLAISKESLEDKIPFLKENLPVSGFFFNNLLLNVELPTFIDYKITNTEPGIKGDTAKGSTKPATIETGAVIQVPLFVDMGDTIRVDTRTNSYNGRV